MSRLAEIAELAIDTVKDVYGHEFGVPAIRSCSALTPLEEEYLRLAGERGLSAPLAEDSPQAELSGELSRVLSRQREQLNRLLARVAELEMAQERLHEENRSATKQIVATTRQLSEAQRQRFSKAQYKQYKDALEDLRQAREISAVLKDLIPALIASSGSNWTDDERLVDIVNQCGQPASRPTNDERL